ncbi:MAG: tRNA dihydrouridine synthase DusA [Cycloclasticus sp. symbiont of Poecilosclerida sp. M]|nr:MAG: tRNA dihydrouridine synthase DusA [Cycloclasticus sp. symbiont of Poecilosclerida sp. M]
MYKLSIAPMMDWTDRHCRYFHRLLSPNALLYTEMVTTGALLHGESERFLRHDIFEYPLALQLGGSEPNALAQCAKLAEQAGFQEVNINVGCPSDRVQSGRFGACLMAEPGLVAQCVEKMQDAVDIPVTVKTRIGIDDFESADFLLKFIEKVSNAGCRVFIIHARKAILKGLSPKENRTVPPLNYGRAYLIKREFPELTVIVNGGIKTVADIEQHWAFADGVMIGREAYQNPYFLAELEQQLFHQALKKREAYLADYLPYVEQQLASGVALPAMTRHILGLFSAQMGGRHWRRHISENAHKESAGIEVIEAALAATKAVAGQATQALN